MYYWDAFYYTNTQMEVATVFIFVYARDLQASSHIVEIWKFIDLHLRERKKNAFFFFLFYFVLSWCLIHYFVYPNVG
jgi:hypothetical protein